MSTDPPTARRDAADGPHTAIHSDQTLAPGPGEPYAGPFVAVRFDMSLGELLAQAGEPGGRPRILVIDGRGGAGKSVLSERIAASVPGTSVVHTDDLAWNRSVMGWGQLLLDHVLVPLRAGDAVDYRPPGWDSDGRPGSVAVPAGCTTVIIEGTGSLRAQIADLVDASVWLQCDFEQAKARALNRDVETAANVRGDRAAAERFWDDWQREEAPFLIEERPWDRATSILATTPVLALEPDEVAVGRPSAVDGRRFSLR